MEDVQAVLTGSVKQRQLKARQQQAVRQLTAESRFRDKAFPEYSLLSIEPIAQ